MTEEPETTTTELKPATDLEETWAIFDPNLEIDPSSAFYVPREDHHLQRLAFDFKRTPGRLHAFLCGHRGSGKTTELKRLRADPAILERYLPVYVSAHELGTEVVDLTHDALMVEIGMALAAEGEKHGMRKSLRKELDDWGQTVVKTFLHDQAALAEAGAKGSAWLAYFRAQLKSRREWKSEQKEILEPKVQDLLDILGRMAQDLKNRTAGAMAYPCFLAAIVLVPAEKIERSHWLGVGLDLVIMMTSAIIAGWFFIFEPLAAQSTEAATGRLFAVSNLILDLLLICVVTVTPRRSKWA